VYFLKKILDRSKYKVNIKNLYKFDISGYYYNIQKTQNDLVFWRYIDKQKGKLTYIKVTLKESKSITKETTAKW